jgi:sugar-specific transcriptional regulator TrmB
MLEKILQDIGLSAAEAKIYLACLKLGTQDVKTLAKETGLTRPDAISILSGLLEKGFVSKFSHIKDFFTPEHPKVVLKILKNEKFEIEEGIRTLNRLLPKFEEFMRPGFTRPEIAYYEGRQGIIAAYEDTLTSKTDILAITSIDDTESQLPDYVRKYYLRRKAAGILIKAIFPDTKMSRARQGRDKQELRISRLVPRNLMDIHIELNIYDDKVAYFSLSEKLAVIVRSRVIAGSMRNVFRMCWKMAEMYQTLKITPTSTSVKKKKR